MLLSGKGTRPRKTKKLNISPSLGLFVLMPRYTDLCKKKESPNMKTRHEHSQAREKCNEKYKEKNQGLNKSDTLHLS
jgi:hypothetical protein